MSRTLGDFDIGVEAIENLWTLNKAIAFPMFSAAGLAYDTVRPLVQDLKLTVGGSQMPTAAANTWQPTPKAENHTALWLLALVATAGLTLYLARR